MSLYSDLGVAQDASETVIKAAYREAAKKAHPDRGGSAEKFNKLNQAKLVLLDPKRRARYDETGEVDTSPDNEFAEIINVAVASIDHVLAVIDRKGVDPCEFDLISDAREGLKTDIISQENILTRYVKSVKHVQNIAERMKSKKGKPNRLKPVFDARVIDFERRIAGQKKSIDRMKAAYDLLGDHKFDSIKSMMSIGYY